MDYAADWDDEVTVTQDTPPDLEGYHEPYRSSKQSSLDLEELTGMETVINTLNEIRFQARSLYNMLQKKGDKEEIQSLMLSMNVHNESIYPAELQWPTLRSTSGMMKLIAETKVPNSGQWRDNVSQSKIFEQFYESVMHLKGSMEKRDKTLSSFRTKASTVLRTLKGADLEHWTSNFADKEQRIQQSFEQNMAADCASARQWGAQFTMPYPSELQDEPDKVSDDKVNHIVYAIDYYKKHTMATRDPLWLGFGSAEEAFQYINAAAGRQQEQTKMTHSWYIEQTLWWYAGLYPFLTLNT